ncbi:MAG: hypothetical protein RMJ56_00680 [Gemmataceae bacterium]|nr:hypothetical protein [Gemmata sp.]MDW8196095.1 hypothetical protein [Gemmataceae bacterium]
MAPRRSLETNEPLAAHQPLNAMETMRSAVDSNSEKPAEKKDEEKMSLFWRVFGGTILSIITLIAINIFNNLSSSIAELRAELNREREARAEFIKKDEFNSRVTTQYERIRGLDSLKIELEAIKERVHNNAATIESIKRDTLTAIEAMRKDIAGNAEAIKKDSAAIEVLRERIAAVETLKKEIATLETLKDRQATAAADLKSLRDDFVKLAGEVEKNKAADLERKTLRDAQYKLVEDTIKELQKGLQDCREKLARLEGSKPLDPAPLPARPNNSPNPTSPPQPNEAK